MLEIKIFSDKKLIQKTQISKEKITIGRTADNDLILPNKHVSRLHAIIELFEDGLRLEDRSTNGVRVDGQRISGSSLLPSRFRLQIFPFEIECLRKQEDETLPIPKESIQKPVDILTQKPSMKPASLTCHFGYLVGESPPMKRVYTLIEDLGQKTATVLIRGEHGTGKELVARSLHEISQRGNRPLIAVNCAAIPFDLIESELFGYEKGAFTGAQTSKKGKIEEAEGGTLFLDEIAELSQAAQAKLLRFLQEKSFMPLGKAQETPVDVRVISATNKDLERSVREENFRADLYYRLKVIQIQIPPLRERLEDIPILTSYILEKLSRELDLSEVPVITPEAIQRLQTGKWPGNIRQLENVLHSALIRSRPPYLIDEELLLSDSPTWVGDKEEQEAPIDTLNKKLLLQVLNQTQWDTAKSAEILKVSRGTIYYKMKKYGIDPRESARGR